MSVTIAQIIPEKNIPMMTENILMGMTKPVEKMKGVGNGWKKNAEKKSDRIY